MSDPARPEVSGLVTASELGVRLGIPASTVLDLFETGKLPGYKIGRAVRFNVDEVLGTCHRPAQRGSDTAS